VLSRCLTGGRGGRPQSALFFTQLLKCLLRAATNFAAVFIRSGLPVGIINAEATRSNRARHRGVERAHSTSRRCAGAFRFMPHGGSVLSTCPRRDETRSDDCASLRVISFTPRVLAKACRFCLCCTEFCPRDRARAEAGRRGPRNQQHSPAGERERFLTTCRPCSRSIV
jgi:hypothetical protein